MKRIVAIAAALAVAGAVTASPEAFAQGRGQGGPGWRTHAMMGSGQALGPCRTEDSSGQPCQGAGPGMARGGQRQGQGPCSTGDASKMPCQGMAQGQGAGRGPGGGMGPRGRWAQQ